MENKKHFAVILGARPNFIKAAPFLFRAKRYPGFKFTLIHTGQHFDKNMSKIFFDEMQIPKPDINLHVSGTLLYTEKIGLMINGLNDILKKNKFDGVIVFGDVNSTLAGAISAVKWGHQLIHIEAGLRSHDKRMPEEMSRVMVDHISDILFTTEPSAQINLIKEGINKKKIKYVGNLMIESLEMFHDKINSSKILEDLGLVKTKFIVATIHRQENTDSLIGIQSVFSILGKIKNYIPVIIPLHPGTRNKIKEFGVGDLLNGLTVIEPQGYLDFMKLVSNSSGVITDSGGIQEETSHLGIPCCTLRDNTERPVTLALGSNKLFDIKNIKITDIMRHLKRSDFKKNSIPLWDKNVSERIFKFL